ncbi:MAG: energy-coupling factor transporter transmembrane component T family protein [Bacilli bacterium]
MNSNIKIGQFINIESAIHKLNPSIKLVSMILFILSLYSSNDISLIIVNTCLVTTIFLISNLSFKTVFIPIWKFKYFLIIWGILSIIMGNSLTTIIIFFTKIIFTLIYSTIFVSTTKHLDIIQSFSILLSPLKKIGFDNEKIAFTLNMSIRFVPIILTESKNILKVGQLRGMNFKDGTIKEKIECLKILMFPLFNLSFNRAERVYEIMEVRSFDSNKVSSKNLQLDENDVLFISLHLFIILIIFIGFLYAIFN